MVFAAFALVLAFARFALRTGIAMFLATLPASAASLVRVLPLDLDVRVLAFAFAAGLLLVAVAVAAGLVAYAPTRRATRIDPATTLRVGQ